MENGFYNRDQLPFIGCWDRRETYAVSFLAMQRSEMHEQALVTGISGFIAKHVALRLLQNGYRVRGTLRRLEQADKVRDTLRTQGADISNLTFAQADLSVDDGWEEATEGCDFVQHVASPFPIKQPRDREALVPEACEGTLRVLTAARGAGVRRVVLTSSTVAMMHRANRAPRITISESDWTDPDWPALSGYIVSKTRAELAAWEWARKSGFTNRLTVTNPGFVLGPALDQTIGTSLGVVKLIMTGSYPALPPVHYPIVDVRDLADLHVKALESPDVVGRRLIAAADTLSFREIATILADAFPDYKHQIPKTTFPAFLVRIISRFDPALRSIVPDLAVVPTADSQYVTDLTGIAFRPAIEAVKAAGDSLRRLSIV